MTVSAEVLRGGVPQTSAMELLQIGHLHSVVAAAGCSLAAPFPDRGIDWTITHESSTHREDDEVLLKVQLKSTYMTAPNPSGDDFPFRLKNPHLQKLAASPVTIPRILVVMLVPQSMDAWVSSEPETFSISHCAYWVNLEGTQPTGSSTTTIRVPTANVFDDIALCTIMERIGRGETP